jgi:hypothetical protein
VKQTTAAVNVILLVALAETWERGLTRGVWGRLLGGVAVLLLTVLVARVVVNLASSPFRRPTGRGAARIAAEQVARDIANLTGPEDRLFYYAHELHGPLLAERKPALPMVSDMVLNFDAWIRREPPSSPMSEEQTATFTKVQGEISADACRRLVADPPAAVVAAMNDLKTWSTVSFEDDLNTVCPAFRPLLLTRYRMHPVGTYHVYIRTDPPPPSATPR